MKFFVDCGHMGCVILFALTACQILARRSCRGSIYYQLTCWYICEHFRTQVALPVVNCFGFSGVFISLFKSFYVFGLTV